MNLHALPVIISAIGNLGLGLFVYTKSKINHLHRAFLFICVVLTVWNINTLGLIIARNENFAWYWAKIFAIGLTLIPPGVLRVMVAFTEYRGKLEKTMLRSSYGLGLAFSILNFCGLFVTGFFKIGSQYFPRAGLTYQLFMFNLIVFVGYAILLVFRKHKEATSGMKRNQIKYFLLAVLLTAIVGSTNFLQSFGIKIYPVGNMATIISTSIVAYAIVKHRLMDIEVVIKKSVVYAALTVSITAIYAIIVGVFHGIFGITRFAQGSLLVNALAAMVIALSFQPLRNKFQRTVDRLFFRDRYDYHKTLKDLSGAVTSILSLEKLLNVIVTSVTEVMHIDKGSLILWDKKAEEFRIKFGKGLRKETIDRVSFKKGNHIIEWLEREKKIFSLEEIEGLQRRKEFSTIEDKRERELFETLGKLKEIGAMLCIPLMVKGRLIAILSLDNKMSGDMFNAEDFELLSTVANQAAIAIENAMLYEEMREMEKDLHRADKLAAVGTLASSIAHEIRNPLVSIKTFAQLVPRKFNNRDFLDKFNSIVPEEMERLENILNQLLNFGRPSEPEFHSINVVEVIDTILELMSTELSQSNIQVIKLYGNDVPQIMADGEQLKQVFMNLVLNAIQAMPEGGSLRVITALRRELAGRNISDCVNIEFQDTGCGISEKNLDNLFSPFFTTKEGGTGLGLSISRRIIEEHNGDISVESELGKGTTFTIKLPVGSKKPTLDTG